MRIAQVALDGNLPRYGVGLVAVRLAEALGRRGHDVSLLCREARAREVAPAPGVRVVPLRHRGGPFGGSRAYVAQVREALRQGADVIHVHGLARMAWWLRAPRARRGAPLVVTAHAADELGPSASAAGTAHARRARRHAAQVRAILARADRVTAPSRWFAARLEAEGARRVAVVGWGRADEAPPPERVPHEGFVVLAMARLVREKGLDVLLQGFADAFADVAGARLVVGGEGPERADLLSRARALGLAARVDFPGYLDGDERRRALASADVLAVPTRGAYETFGLAALDGSAAGLPLLVSDGGALPERVEGGAGATVPSGDVGAWGRALRALFEDPTRRERQGQAGRRLALAATWDRTAREFERLYDELRRP